MLFSKITNNLNHFFIGSIQYCYEFLKKLMSVPINAKYNWLHLFYCLNNMDAHHPFIIITMLINRVVIPL